MRRIQTMYYEAVGKRYGMQRGTPSSITGLTAAEPDRVKGLRTRAALAEAELERLRTAGRCQRQGAAAMQLEVDGVRAREAISRRVERKVDRARGVQR